MTRAMMSASLARFQLAQGVRPALKITFFGRLIVVQGGDGLA